MKKLYKKVAKAKAAKATKKEKEHKKSNKVKEENIPFVPTFPVRFSKAKLGFSMGTADIEFAGNARDIASALRRNASGYFPSPFQDQDLLEDSIMKFFNAIDNLLFRIPGASETKNEVKRKLMTFLNSALGYVNSLAAYNPADSEQIILAANMQVIIKPVIVKKELTAKWITPDKVLLQAAAEKISGKAVKAVYNWQASADGGATWGEIYTSLDAKIVLPIPFGGCIIPQTCLH